MTINNRKLLEIVQKRNGMAKGAWGKKTNVRIVFIEIKSKESLGGKKTTPPKGKHKSENKMSYDAGIIFWTKIFVADKVDLKWLLTKQKDA